MYDLSRSQEGEYGIKTITREMAKTKMKPPACEAVWELKLAQRIQFDKVWKIKADYVSPRDQIAWLKTQHMNLWVAASGVMHGSPKCSAAGCNLHDADVDSSALSEMYLRHLYTCALMDDVAAAWVVYQDCISNVSGGGEGLHGERG